jgi:hypothetical protein
MCDRQHTHPDFGGYAHPVVQSDLPSRPCTVRGRAGDPLPGMTVSARPGRIDCPGLHNRPQS